MRVEFAFSEISTNYLYHVKFWNQERNFKMYALSEHSIIENRAQDFSFAHLILSHFIRWNYRVDVKDKVSHMIDYKQHILHS